jgi:Asp-tRNA(Asn)/Glu-tRNA(Gln) amidotransferase A subunit family amidase
LPIGLQIFGRHFDEATVLRVAAAYEASSSSAAGGGPPRP